MSEIRCGLSGWEYKAYFRQRHNGASKKGGPWYGVFASVGGGTDLVRQQCGQQVGGGRAVPGGNRLLSLGAGGGIADAADGAATVAVPSSGETADSPYHRARFAGHGGVPVPGLLC